MSDLMLYRQGWLQSRVERQTGQALQQIRAGQAIVSAQQIAKVEVIAETTEAALLATSNIAAVEALLCERTPHAEGRLRHIADAGSIGLAEVVLKAKRGLS